MSRVTKPTTSTERKHCLLGTIGTGRKIMRPCKPCTRLHKECRVGNESGCCTSCISSGAKCDLSFSPKEWTKVQQQRDQKLDEFLAAQAQVSAAAAKAERLRKEFEFLDRRGQEMVDRELSNIAELEADKSATAGPSLDNILFDVSSKRIEFSPSWFNLPGALPTQGNTPQGS